MRATLLALSILASLPLLSRDAQAQPCCWGYGYRVRYYRVQPYYQYVYAAPPAPQWSIGLHATGIMTNQMFGGDSVMMAGGGANIRVRGYRWGGEFGIDGMGGKYLDGQIKRMSFPFQASALLYLIPEGRFNLYLLAGFRIQATHMDLDMAGLKRDQTFAEIGLHGGAGADLILTRGLALTADVRFFGMFRDDSSSAGKFYEGLPAGGIDGIVKDKTFGMQLNLGVAFRF
jgi:hypothetical protein